jgi:cation transport regulator ChaC
MNVLYFAFASNMVPAQMAERCPGAASRGVAVLEDHRFHIGRRGYATVVGESGASVYGILWELRPAHEDALDVYEGVRHGLYRKVHLPVRSADGTTHQAIVYVAGDPARGNAVAGYMEKVVAAAEAHSLPAAYVAELRSWLPNHE